MLKKQLRNLQEVIFSGKMQRGIGKVRLLIHIRAGFQDQAGGLNMASANCLVQRWFELAIQPN